MRSETERKREKQSLLWEVPKQRPDIIYNNSNSSSSSSKIIIRSVNPILLIPHPNSISRPISRQYQNFLSPIPPLTR